METNYKYSFVPLPNDTRIFHFRAPASRPLSCMLFMCLYFQWNHAIHAVLQNATSKLCSINIEYKRNICNTYIQLKIRTLCGRQWALQQPYNAGTAVILISREEAKTQRGSANCVGQHS